MCNARKGPLCNLRTTQAQIRKCICTVWFERFLFVDIYFYIHWFRKRALKALISLRLCAGWSGSALSANCLKTLFVRCDLYVFSWRNKKNYYPIPPLIWSCGFRHTASEAKNLNRPHGCADNMCLGCLHRYQNAHFPMLPSVFNLVYVAENDTVPIALQWCVN